MVDFCIPNMLDTYTVFKRQFETPIVKSRAPDCTSAEKKLGESQSKAASLKAEGCTTRADHFMRI